MPGPDSEVGSVSASVQTALRGGPDRADHPWEPDNADEVYLPRGLYLLAFDKFGARDADEEEVRVLKGKFLDALQLGILKATYRDPLGKPTTLESHRWRGDLRGRAFDGIVSSSSPQNDDASSSKVVFKLDFGTGYVSKQNLHIGLV